MVNTPPRVHVLAMAILAQVTATGIDIAVRPWSVRMSPIHVDANGEGVALSGPRQGTELWAGSGEDGLDALYHAPAQVDLQPLDLDAAHTPVHMISPPNASHTATARCIGRTPSAPKCQALCTRLTGCTAFVWRPRGDGVQRRLCPRCASRAWDLQCCLRFDDVWEPVRGAESAGPGTVSGLAFSFVTTLPRFGKFTMGLQGNATTVQEHLNPPAPAPTLAIPADTHGSLWALGRAVCQSSGMDLCPSSALRHNTATRNSGYSLAVPVLDRCREWSRLLSPLSSSLPSSQPYWWGASEASSMRGVHLACCRPSGVKSLSVAETVDTTCLDAAAIEDALAAGEDISAEALAAPKAGCKTVLRIGLNHGGAGFFAQVLFALNQLRYARDRGLVPYVDFGPCTLPGHVTGSVNRFFDGNAMAVANSGNSWGNAWEYFFEPVSTYRPGDLGVAVRALESDQMWALHSSSRKSVYAYYYGRFAGKRPGGAATNVDAFDAKWYSKMRRRAAALIARYLRPQPHITQKVDQFWTSSGCAYAPFVVGVHMRGTDKAPDIGGAIVPPAAYYRFIDQQLVVGGPRALVFLATDSPRFLEDAKQKYGARLRHTRAIRSEKNAFLSDDGDFDGGEADSGDGGHGPARKGMDVLVDALLLSRCDYLIKSSSAVGEFAVYFSKKLRLDKNSKDIQFLSPAAGIDDDVSPLLKH